MGVKPRYALFFLLMTLLPRAAHAQVVTAALSGKVEDTSGAGVGGAYVTVTSLETGATRFVWTDDHGNFKVLSLPLGPQEVKAELSGRIQEKDFNLSPGKIVKKGEIMVRLDTVDLQLALERDQIAYEALKDTFEADHSAEFTLQSAKIDLANAERGHKLGSLSEQAWDQAKRTMELTVQSQKLTAIDHQTCVLLGDPTVRMRPFSDLGTGPRRGL